MTKEEKRELVVELTEVFRESPDFYIFNTEGFSVEKDNAFRRKCYQENLRVKVVKNKLIRKSLENLGEAYSTIYPALKGTSAIVFVNDDTKAPARVAKTFREDGELPKLKGAFIEECAYLGDESLELLLKIKSKKDLLGEVVGLLQSPAQNVISALKSPGAKLAGILKTLEEKNS